MINAAPITNSGTGVPACNSGTGVSARAPMIDAGQRKALFAIARRLGQDVHDLAGVASLKTLTHAQAAAILDQLNARTGYVKRPRGTAVAGSQLRMSDDADRAQRDQLCALFEELGWSWPKRNGWLRNRFNCDDLYTGRLEYEHYQSAVRQLKRALSRARADIRARAEA